jgi:drug/metabolite transporter (DMT)-like permease
MNKDANQKKLLEETILQMKSYAKIVVCAGVFGTAAGMLFIRQSEASPLAILFYRLLFTSLIIAVILLIRNRKETINVLKEGLKWYKDFLLIALFNTSSMVCWFFAVKNTSIASAVIISNTHPVLVLLISIFVFKIKYNKKAILGALITLVGCIAMSAGDYMATGSHIIGDLFAFAAGMLFGIYLLTAKKVREKFSIDVFMFINYTLAFFYTAIIVLLLKVDLLPMPAHEWLNFVCLALLSTVMGHGFVDWGLKYVSSSFASLSFLLENVFAIVLAMIFLGEFPLVSQLVFGGVLIVGVLIFNKYEQADGDTKVG